MHRFVALHPRPQEDRAALETALGSPQGAAAAADVANFATGGVVLLDYEVAGVR